MATPQNITSGRTQSQRLLRSRSCGRHPLRMPGLAHGARNPHRAADLHVAYRPFRDAASDQQVRNVPRGYMVLGSDADRGGESSPFVDCGWAWTRILRRSTRGRGPTGSRTRSAARATSTCCSPCLRATRWRCGGIGRRTRTSSGASDPTPAVIMFDRRGMGSSEPASGETMPSWEQWADDARAVLDAAGSTRAVVLGTYDGGHAGLLFAASHPQRTRGLILVNTAASLAPAQEDHLHPWRNQQVGIQDFVAQTWGSAAIADITFPDSARDPAFMRWALSSMRLACSPREAGALFAEQSRMDVRHVLTSVKVPTLVLHRNGCPLVPVGDAAVLGGAHTRSPVRRAPWARSASLDGTCRALRAEHRGLPR